MSEQEMVERITRNQRRAAYRSRLIEARAFMTVADLLVRGSADCWSSGRSLTTDSH